MKSWIRIVQGKIGIERFAALVLLILLIIVRTWDPVPLQVLRLKTFDYFQILKPRIQNGQPVVIVDIDERSLKAHGQWPWSRLLVADLVERIGKLGAASIGIDILFPEPDRMSPRLVADELRGLSETIRQVLRGLPDNDTAFAEAIRKNRVVLAQSGLGTGTGEADTAGPQTPIVTLGPDPKPFMLRLPMRIGNLPELEKAAAGRGLVTIIPEIDGIVRRVPTVMVIQDQIIPTMAIELLRVAVGAKSIAIRTDQAGISRIVLGNAAIPTDGNGLVWLNISKHDQQRFISAADVLSDKLPAGSLKGKIVLIGTSSTGLFDQKPTAIEPAIPGVEIHAQLIENIVSGSPLKRPRFALGMEIALTALICLAMIVTVPIYGARFVLPTGLVVSATVIGISWRIYDTEQTLIDIWFPLLVSIAIFWLLVILNYLREEGERTMIRNAFSRYISTDLVEQLTENREQLVLGGQTRELTVLFSDIRKFTKIAEGYKDDPQGLTTLINRFLTPLSEAILERRGTIDKYMGDAIMAFWNAPANVPNHAAQACDAALEMLARLAVLNDTLHQEALAQGRQHTPLRVGVGINTGACVVGNLGSDLRFDYSALGDSVNLASRIEGLTKQYGLSILVGENTAAASSNHAFIEVELIRVVGKDLPERIYTLLGDAEMARSESFQRFTAEHQDMLEAYRKREWSEALDALVRARGLAPPSVNIDGLFDVFQKRITDYSLNPPSPDWDGVVSALEK